MCDMLMSNDPTEENCGSVYFNGSSGYVGLQYGIHELLFGIKLYIYIYIHGGGDLKICLEELTKLKIRNYTSRVDYFPLNLQTNKQ